MKAELTELIIKVIQVLQINMRWMTWNLFLAFIPLLLSIWLFRGRQKSSLAWWPVFFVFYAFLPNAPYLLTDIIHLIDDIRNIPSIWVITLILIPIYLLVILAGFQAYVISLINLGHYLHRMRQSQWIVPVELITHILNAIGIYWGRFLRFNSWDLVTQPDIILTKGIEELLGKQPLVIIIISFIILWGLYSLMKQITLGIIYRLTIRKGNLGV
ncbi:hypothetical protein B7O87_00880 [Cylindrospermopsis raciborskii CENA303]|uniref:DUF1361 domain-containing protein n=1 Tax=Cylindrospermopsis raciborskii CENA303 TaxID=1170769 RepID=A0A1X4GJM7_9CYAN|nr:DUF1361 domain-containing protein [Cylindrospermopsis raciborskii]OSO97356.1 hypothetical protein B7O87_00880 [Cylindrospermopsis raciborskii CENA303]